MTEQFPEEQSTELSDVYGNNPEIVPVEPETAPPVAEYFTDLAGDEKPVDDENLTGIPSAQAPSPQLHPDSRSDTSSSTPSNQPATTRSASLAASQPSASPSSSQPTSTTSNSLRTNSDSGTGTAAYDDPSVRDVTPGRRHVEVVATEIEHPFGPDAAAAERAEARLADQRALEEKQTAPLDKQLQVMTGAPGEVDKVESVLKEEKDTNTGQSELSKAEDTHKPPVENPNTILITERYGVVPEDVPELEDDPDSDVQQSQENTTPETDTLSDPTLDKALDELMGLAEKVGQELDDGVDYDKLTPLPKATVWTVAEELTDAGNDGQAQISPVEQQDALAVSRAQIGARLGVEQEVMPPPGFQRSVTGATRAALTHTANIQYFDARERVGTPDVRIYSSRDWEQARETLQGEPVTMALRPSIEDPVIALADGTILVRLEADTTAVLAGIQKSVVASLADREYRLADTHAGGLRLIRDGYATAESTVAGEGGEYSVINDIVTTRTTVAIIREQWPNRPELAANADDAANHLVTPEMAIGEYVIDTIVDERMARSGGLSREQVAADVDRMLEAGRLSGQTEIINELVHAAFGAAGVDVVSGWGAKNGYSTGETEVRLRLIRENKLDQDRQDRKRQRQPVDQTAAIDDLTRAAELTGDLHSETDGDVLTVDVETAGHGYSGDILVDDDAGTATGTNAGTAAGASQTSNRDSRDNDHGTTTPFDRRPANDENDPRRMPTVDESGVHQPIFDEATVAVRELGQQHEDDDGTKTSAGVDLLGAIREELPPGLHARAVRAAAREFGITSRELKDLGSIDSIEAAVAQRIQQRLGAAAVGVGANVLIQTRQTGDGEPVRVKVPGVVLDERQLVRTIRNAAARRNEKTPELIARALFNTVVRSERALFAEGLGGGRMNAGQATGVAKTAPVVLGQTRRPEVSPDERRQQERDRHQNRMTRLQHPRYRSGGPHRPSHAARIRAEQRRHQRNMDDLDKQEARSQLFKTVPHRPPRNFADSPRGQRRSGADERIRSHDARDAARINRQRNYTTQDYKLEAALLHRRRSSVYRLIRRMQGRDQEHRHALEQADWRKRTRRASQSRRRP